MHVRNVELSASWIIRTDAIMPGRGSASMGMVALLSNRHLCNYCITEKVYSSALLIFSMRCGGGYLFVEEFGPL
jgi:hypothetical protein